ncbi:hypothetical protein [Hymenobacter sp. BT730]|uniref:chryseobasin-related MNIO class RiPP peptide n=1 Tax=Hymenobacter sp. BT730 TaxID=3063332 RepID=UPI0026E06550|nr:hypothetical protein [Hymenobacter sp. BT730]
MKLPKALLGAIVVGLTVQTTGCSSKDTPTPKGEQVSKDGKTVTTIPDNCPACGRG